MNNFKTFLAVNDKHVTAILECVALAEIADEPFEPVHSLNEAALDKVHHKLKQVGVHIKKGKGLIDYALSAGKGIAQLIGAAVKGDEDRIKEIAKSVKKEDVLDFLLKLDQATMHIVTGPIHLIDAVTGWHIGADISSAAQSAVQMFKTAIQTAKDTVQNIIGNPKTKKKISANISRIEALITV